MKNKKSLLVFSILFVISLCLQYSFITNNGINAMDDMPFHLNRIQCLAENLKTGVILPSVYGSAINGYGYANSLFYPDLFLYIPAILVAFNMNLVLSYKIFIFLINLATGIATYISIKNILEIKNIKNRKDSEFFKYEEKIALLSTCIYLVFPYRLIDIYVRSAVGEILAFIFIPIAMWGLYEIFEKEDGNYKVLVLGMVGILSSHIITLFLMSIFVLIFALSNYKKIKEKSVMLLKATIHSVLIGAILLFPMIEQMLSDTFYYQEYKPLKELFDHSFKLFKIENQLILIALNILLITVILLMFKYIKKLKTDISVKYLFIGLYILLLISDFFPWVLVSKIPMMSFIQFPWRLLIFCTWFISIAISTKTIDLFNGTSFKIISILTILISLFVALIYIEPFVGENEYTKSKDYVPHSNSIGFGEYLPIDYSYKEHGLDKPKVNVLNDKELDYSLNKKGNQLTIEFKSNSDNLELEIPLIYYKGYKAYVNDEKVNISKNDGLININTKNHSEGTIIVKYKPTLVQITSLLISMSSIILFIKPLKLNKLKEN